MSGRTIAAAIEAIVPVLSAAGIDNPRREARLLVALALEIEPGMALGYPERALDGAAETRLAAMVARRAAREPYARIAGRRSFWRFDLEITPATLDPRPDSETLVETALAILPDREAELRLIDFGTGTGALLLALLLELPRAWGVGVELRAEAALVARRNAASLGLADRASFVVGNWGAAIGGAADVIVANPPYIPSGEIGALAPEVARYEPRMALDGGADGLAAYRNLAPAIARLLAPRGMAFLELGRGQKGAVAAEMARAGLKVLRVGEDLARVERCLVVAPNRP